VSPSRLLLGALAGVVLLLPVACGGREGPPRLVAETVGSGPQTATIIRLDVRRRLPVVLFLHGWGATRPRFYRPWLDQLVQKRNLPQKLFLIHQFTNDMVDDAQLKPRRGLAMVLNADGFGTQANKNSKYRAFTKSPRKFFHQGYKLFYREDTDLMSPRQVLRLRPPPDVVIYE